MGTHLERLAAACLLPGFVGTSAPEWVRRRLAAGLGGVVLYARNVADPEQVAALTAALRAERPDALVAIDEEGGDVTRLEAATGSSWPGNLALGVAGDPGLTRAAGAGIGAELAAAGITVDFAPVADVSSNPDNPVIGVRSFGADPHLVATHTAAMVAGLQAAGVAACVKHFPGHGDTTVDSHLALPTVGRDLDGALVPFRAAVRAGVRCVMTAHVLVPGLTDEPATMSRRVLTGLLREELGFDGLVITDALEMGAIGTTVGMAEGAVRALAAGADALCVGGGHTSEAVADQLTGALVEAVRAGRLPEERLAEAAARVERVGAWTTAARRRPAPPADRAAGLAAARRAVLAEGMVAVGAGALVVELQPAPSIAAGKIPWGVGRVLAERDPSVTVLRCGPAPGADGVQVLAVPPGEGSAPAAGLGEGPGVDAAALASQSGTRVDARRVVDLAARRPLVVVVRDLHRHAWQRELVEGLLARRGDAVVVEMGVPASRPVGGGGYLRTHGAGAVNALAAAELLLAPVGGRVRSGRTGR